MITYMSKHTSVVSDSTCHAEIIKVWLILEYKIHHNTEFLNGIPRVKVLCLLPDVDSMLASDTSNLCQEVEENGPGKKSQ